MGKHLKGVFITVLQPNKDLLEESGWTITKVVQWIRAAGGEFASKLTEDTTHLVLSEAQWRQQGSEVKTALDSKSQTDKPSIKIVTTDWLKNSLNEKSKKVERQHLWENIRPINARDDHSVARQETEVVRRVGAPSLMAEVFAESTDGYLSERQIAEIDEQREVMRAEQEKATAERVQRQNEAKREFQEGARKARQSMNVDNYHIYTDSDGFKYEVVLIKTAPMQNLNQRVTLTIFESNFEPQVYAVHSHFAATKTKPHNMVLAGAGCPFETAWRLFKNAFKHFTTKNWDDRVQECVDPPARTKAEAKQNEATFEKRPFRYLVPPSGPRGRLPYDFELGDSSTYDDPAVLAELPDPNNDILAEDDGSPRKRQRMAEY